MDSGLSFGRPAGRLEPAADPELLDRLIEHVFGTEGALFVDEQPPRRDPEHH